MAIVDHSQRFIGIIKSFTQSSPRAGWRQGIWDRVSNGRFGGKQAGGHICLNLDNIHWWEWRGHAESIQKVLDMFSLV